MDFIESAQEGFRRYFDFNTRSSRSEYWWFTLFVVMMSILATTIDISMFNTEWGGNGPIGIIWSLATFIPGISIAVRRLHDIDRSGWWFLLIFVIFIGWIVLLVWFCTKGTHGENRFGYDPLGDGLSEVFD